MAFKFEITHICRTWRHRATFDAVCRPVIPRQWPALGEKASLGRLRTMWRARVVKLSKAKVPEFSKDNFRFQVACNCPPFGVRVRQTQFTCQRATVCPFCWGRRYVQAPFKYVEEIIKQHHFTDGVLLVLETKFAGRVDAKNAISIASGAALSTDPGSSRRRDRRNEMDKVRYRFKNLVLGGFGIWSVDVGVDGMYYARRALVAAVNGYQRDYDLDKFKAKGWRTYPLNRKGLRTVIARVCRYPAGMLVNRDIDKVAVLIAMLRRRHLVSYYR